MQHERRPHRNTGTPPRHELVDLRFRNGRIRRGEKPEHWRWTLDDPRFPPAWEYDVLSWQPAVSK